MLNAEKYKNEILEKSNVVFDFSMSKDKHTIKKCLGVCDDCFFHEAGDHCSNIKIKWLLSEYKEPVKVSSLEYELLKFWDVGRYKYITRDRDRRLFVYKEKPSKKYDCWASLYGHHMLDNDFYNLFKFVKWEDKEPTSIEYVLKNCEVVEDESNE